MALSQLTEDTPCFYCKTVVPKGGCVCPSCQAEHHMKMVIKKGGLHSLAGWSFFFSLIAVVYYGLGTGRSFSPTIFQLLIVWFVGSIVSIFVLGYYTKKNAKPEYGWMRKVVG